MKIIIAANIYPPEVGGPAHYIKSLEQEFKTLGHKVSVVKYGFLKKLPTGLRHLLYSIKLAVKSFNADLILAMDTYSVGLPVALVSKMLGKKSAVRIGGDFLWEIHIERSKDSILLSEFYQNNFEEKLNTKEKIIYKLSVWALSEMKAIIFSTEWQKNLWQKPYKLDNSKVFVLENSLPKRKEMTIKKPSTTFVWAGRDIFIKNLDRLKKAYKIAKRKNNEITLKMLTEAPQDILHQEIQDNGTLIIPSLSEVSPNIILEAISLGTPFILTKDTGLYERFHSLGLFVNPLDENDITEKMLEIAENERHQAIIKRLRDFDYKERAYGKIAEEFINIFKEL